MKTTIKILTTALMIAFLSASAQPELTFRLAKLNDASQKGNTTRYALQIKASESGTFHTDLQVYLDYNTAVFGKNIVEAGKVTLVPGDLLNGQFAGVDKYKIVNMADNTASRFAIITEPLSNGGNPAETLSEITGEFQNLFTLEIATDQSPAGGDLLFAEDLMNGGEYYRSGEEVEKYASPCQFEYGEITGTGENNPTVTELQQINLSPNPFENMLNVGIPGSPACTVTINNLLGQEQFRRHLKTGETGMLTIDLTGRESGIYILSVTAGDQTTSRKIIKK